MSERHDVELLTLREADKMLGKRRGFVLSLIESGQLAYLAAEPGRYRVPVFELRRWLAATLKKKAAR